MDLTDTFRTLLDRRPLAEAEAEELFNRILEGQLDHAQIAAVLSLIQQRGATVDELVGGARAMRARVTPVPVPSAPPGLRQVVLDTCGTGGALKTFNISTAVAIVTAAASPHHEGGDLRVLVAKHGNRSRSGRGSAEVLAALGVNVDASPEVQGRCLGTAGVCFCFAIHHHPAMKHAGPARRALPFPTIFNLLGPLTNPARAPRQLMGVYSADCVRPMGEALHRLGIEAAIVVHGAGNMDEISTIGPTSVCRVSASGVVSETWNAAPVGIAPCRVEDLCAHDLEHGVTMVRAVLNGERGPCRDVVLINAAAALLVAGAVDDLAAGVERASRAIEVGRARQTLERLATASLG